VIASGLDTRVLASFSSGQTSRLETSLARTLGIQASDVTTSAAMGPNGQLMLPVEGQLPPLNGIGPWINSPPLTREGIRGKVVVIDFWTYSCINCLRSVPYVSGWYRRYARDGLVVIGVHAPEFAFERNFDNVKKAVSDLGIRYPVALDNDWTLWRALHNNYWPAHYFVDAKGRVRYHHFGEGGYAESERVIRQLLAEAGHAPAGPMATTQASRAAEMGAAYGDLQSRETYIGYGRAEGFASPGGQSKDAASDYAIPSSLDLNQWGLGGRWTVGRQVAVLQSVGGKIAFRFHARDLHLVLGPGPGGKPVRFRISIDGRLPGADSGADVKADGSGAVTGERLYQLVRQRGDVKDRTFQIEFLDPGVQAFSFTFG
jgi:thiol-disulfide isomerase/thioredoxin